jgi:predicted transcriptional regulator
VNLAERDEQIRADRATLTVREIAERYGLSKRQVNRIVYGEPHRQANVNSELPTGWVEDEVFRGQVYGTISYGYSQGYTDRHIARLAKCSERTVLRWRQRNHKPAHRPGLA